VSRRKMEKKEVTDVEKKKIGRKGGNEKEEREIKRGRKRRKLYSEY
jgi:hypothetical protein